MDSAQGSQGQQTVSYPFMADTKSKRSAGNWKHDKRSRHARGYGTAWDKLRKQAMDRDTWLCQPCKRKGKLTPATEVDHLVPKFEGGTDDLENLAATCAPCHRIKTQAEAARSQGHTIRARRVVGLDGYPIE